MELNAYLGIGAPWDLDRSDGGVHVLPPYVQEDEKGAGLSDFLAGAFLTGSFRAHRRIRPDIKYRIIDFPLSNCINSGIDTVGVLTQYKPMELNAYLGIIRSPLL